MDKKLGEKGKDVLFSEESVLIDKKAGAEILNRIVKKKILGLIVDKSEESKYEATPHSSKKEKKW